MSFDLARALHDAVDDGPGPRTGTGPVGTLSDDRDVVGHLASRIRRRRAVRAGVRGGVGLATAGAVAIVGGQIAGRRGLGDALPAAVPGAEPGTCGSDVAALGPSTGTDAIGIAAVGTAWSDGASWTVDSSADLGVLRGRELSTVVTAGAPEGGSAGPVFLVVTHDGTVVSDLPPVTDLTGTATLTVGAEGATSWVSLGEDARLTFTGGLGGVPNSSSAATEALVTCTVPGADTSDAPLPAGDYEVYAYQDTVSSVGVTERRVEGPWSLTLLDQEGSPVILPPGFPQDLPVVDGTLVDSVTLDGTTDDGWLATVEVDGTDGLTRAVRALESSGFSASGATTALMGFSDRDPGFLGISGYSASSATYDVTLTETNDNGGPREVQYQIRQR